MAQINDKPDFWADSGWAPDDLPDGYAKDAGGMTKFPSADGLSSYVYDGTTWRQKNAEQPKAEQPAQTTQAIAPTLTQQAEQPAAQQNQPADVQPVTATAQTTQPDSPEGDADKYRPKVTELEYEPMEFDATPYEQQREQVRKQWGYDPGKYRNVSDYYAAHAKPRKPEKKENRIGTIAAGLMDLGMAIAEMVASNGGLVPKRQSSALGEYIKQYNYRRKLFDSEVASWGKGLTAAQKADADAIRADAKELSRQLSDINKGERADRAAIAKTNYQLKNSVDKFNAKERNAAERVQTTAKNQESRDNRTHSHRMTEISFRGDVQKSVKRTPGAKSSGGGKGRKPSETAELDSQIIALGYDPANGVGEDGKTYVPSNSDKRSFLASKKNGKAPNITLKKI